MDGGAYRLFLLAWIFSLAISSSLRAENPNLYERMREPFMQEAPGRLFYPADSLFREFFAGVYTRTEDSKGLRVFRTPINHPSLPSLEISTTAFIADKGPFKLFIGIANSETGPVSGGGMMLQFASPPRLEGPGLFRMVDGLRHRQISFPMRFEDFSTDPDYSNMLRFRDLLFPKGKTKEPIIVNLQFSTTNHGNPSLGVWVDDPSGNFRRAADSLGSPQEKWMTSGGGWLVKWDTGSRLQKPEQGAVGKPTDTKAQKEEMRRRELHEALLTQSLKVKPTDKKGAEPAVRNVLWEKVRRIATKSSDQGFLSSEIDHILTSSEALMDQFPMTVKEAALLESLVEIKNPQSLPREFWRDSLHLFGTLLSKNNQRGWSRELFDSEKRLNNERLEASLQPLLKTETLSLLNDLLNDRNSEVSAAAQFLLEMQIENPAVATKIANRLAATSPFLRGKAAVEEIEAITGRNSKTKMQVPRAAKDRIKSLVSIPAISDVSDTHRGLKQQMEKSLRTSALEPGEYFSLLREYLGPESDYEKLPRMGRVLFLNPARREKLSAKWRAELYPEIGIQTVDPTAGSCRPGTLERVARGVVGG